MNGYYVRLEVVKGLPWEGKSVTSMSHTCISALNGLEIFSNNET